MELIFGMLRGNVTVKGTLKDDCDPDDEYVPWDELPMEILSKFREELNDSKEYTDGDELFALSWR